MIVREPEIPIMAKQSFVTRQQPLLDEVCAFYGRDPSHFCLKVFYGNPLKEGETLEDALWGDNHDPTDSNQVRRNTRLLVGTKIQNILWWHGLSARVYAVFEAEYQGQRVACQLTDFIEGEFASDIKQVEALHNNELARLGKEYGFSDVKDILSTSDVIAGKVIDVQQYAFDDSFEEKLKEVYFEKGRYGKVYYQDVPELGLRGGPRKSLDRVGYMKLDKIDFNGKVVWDLGCAGGFFCRYALQRGAKVVYGFDEPDPCFAAFMVGNYLGAFNIDYVACDLAKPMPRDIPKPDIAFCLSLNFHIPFPDRLFEADTVIFEDNGKESRLLDKLEKPWTDYYSRIELVGRAEDQGNCQKPIYWLQR